ncbi:ankyrin repeat domain-containing protein 49-like isoform X2 [Papaver somniferum]|uniref:ankyrin repeat domain-containing protein 49-like isoform X2 n=1 Tax=Papaver somniferum TaxID=3469 RepID=UPI000E6FA775|nr:ankyrin repeat domain-containing protein 49-like isoform X2 [Papaver somniferum]
MDRIGPTFMTVKAQGVEVGKAIRKLVDEDDGESLLHAAATGGRLNVCKYLVETLKVDVDFKDGDGYVPLHHAIFKGHLDIVRYLLEKGAKADASSDGNYTPLHIAAKTGDTKIITLLLSSGVHIDAATRIGTALQYAAGHGHREFEMLLKCCWITVQILTLSLVRECLVH